MNPARTRKPSKTGQKETRFDCKSAHVELQDVEECRARTIAAGVCRGTSRIYRVSIPDEEYLEVKDTRFDNGDRHVAADFVHSSSKALRRLEHGLRLSVYPAERNILWVELSQAQPKAWDPGQWSTLRKASMTELSEGAGTDIRAILMKVGATRVGTKALLLGHDDKRSGYCCATFPKSAEWVPVVAYVLTRVLPLLSRSPY